MSELDVTVADDRPVASRTRSLSDWEWLAAYTEDESQDVTFDVERWIGGFRGDSELPPHPPQYRVRMTVDLGASGYEWPRNGLFTYLDSIGRHTSPRSATSMTLERNGETVAGALRKLRVNVDELWNYDEGAWATEREESAGSNG